MMIVGFAVTAGVTGRCSTPIPPARLVAVTAVGVGAGLAVTVLAVWGLEGRGPGHAREAPMPRPAGVPRRAGAGVGRPDARRFTVFVFVSMLAYSAQDLILEPFAGCVLRLSRRASRPACRACSMAACWPGMLLAAMAGRRWRGIGFGRCAAGRSAAAWRLSALAMVGLAAAPGWRVRLAAARHGVRAGRGQRRVLDRRHRSMMRWPPRAGAARRRAHGPVGRGAGHRVRAGRRGIGTAPATWRAGWIGRAGAAYASVFALRGRAVRGLGAAGGGASPARAPPRATLRDGAGGIRWIARDEHEQGMKGA
jgi:BCD family chlorophyll transporter-like MFS transporter